MFEIGQSLTVQLGPIAGRADGPLAIVTLLAMIALYVFGAPVAGELVRRLSKRKPEQ
jgi:hypothetical protein